MQMQLSKHPANSHSKLRAAIVGHGRLCSVSGERFGFIWHESAFAQPDNQYGHHDDRQHSPRLAFSAPIYLWLLIVYHNPLYACKNASSRLHVTKAGESSEISGLLTATDQMP